jgi:hypothetical protein
MEPEHLLRFSFTAVDYSYAETDESRLELIIVIQNLFSYYLFLFHSHIQVLSFPLRFPTTTHTSLF